MEDILALSKTYGSLGAIVIFILYYSFELIKNSINNRSNAKIENIKNTANINFQNEIFKQLSENNEINKQLTQYLQILSNKYTENITESQAKVIIEKVFCASKYKVLEYITNIININHIKDNEREVIAKIEQFIQNSYNEDSIFLKEFKYKVIPLSDFMKEEWNMYLKKVLTEIVLNQKGINILNSTLDNAFVRFKNEMTENLFNY